MPREEISLVAPERVLETRRLLLEPLTGAHAAGLYGQLLDGRLYAFIPQDPPASERELEDRYRRLSGRRERRTPAGTSASWRPRSSETARPPSPTPCSFRTSARASPRKAANGCSGTCSRTTAYRRSWRR